MSADVFRCDIISYVSALVHITLIYLSQREYFGRPRRFTGAGTSSEHRKFPGRNPNVNVFQNHSLLATGNRKALNHIFGFYHIIHSDTSLVFTKLQRLGNINLTNQLTKNYHADYNHNADDAKETNHIKRLKHNCKRYRLVG